MRSFWREREDYFDPQNVGILMSRVFAFMKPRTPAVRREEPMIRAEAMLMVLACDFQRLLTSE